MAYAKLVYRLESAPLCAFPEKASAGKLDVLRCPVGRCSDFDYTAGRLKAGHQRGYTRPKIDFFITPVLSANDFWSIPIERRMLK